jgi:hypothetical protein
MSSAVLVIENVNTQRVAVGCSAWLDLFVFNVQ